MQSITEKTKLSELLTMLPTSFKALQMLGCKGDYTTNDSIAEFAETNKIPAKRILYVLTQFDEPLLESKSIEKLPLKLLIKYIHQSHYKILVEFFPKLLQLQHVIAVAHSAKDEVWELLASLIERFRAEIVCHIMFETDDVLPFIDQLLLAERGLLDAENLKSVLNKSIPSLYDAENTTQDFIFKINEYIGVIKDFPTTLDSNQQAYLQLLTSFTLFLNDHEYLEDHYLYPNALALENRIRARFEAV